jgi:[acyl-carrier-protein] S-malonyltransferase
MAAILGLADNIIEEICAGITDEIVVPANYNCPGQVVISGTFEGVEKACELLKAAGAKRALILPVGGAFHSPLMEPARAELATAIDEAQFQPPTCAVYQNVNAKPATEVNVIKQNLISQLTAPVRWTQSVEQMVADGAESFIECGPGKVLQGLVKKIAANVEIKSI